MHIVDILLDDLHRVGVALLQNFLDGLIHHGGGLLRTVETVAAVEILAAHGAERHHAELVAHAVHGDHVARDVRGLLNVLRGAVGHRVHDDLLGGTAAHGDGDLRHQLVAGAQIRLVLLGHEERVAEAPLGMGHNGDLLHGLGVLLPVGDHRVADLVVGDELLFKLGEHAVLLLAARDDELERGEHILLRDELAALAHGAQRRLVHDVGKVRADAAGGRERDLLEIDVLTELDVAGVDLERGDAAREVRAVDGDPAVEAARAQQRLIEHLGAVGGGENDDALAGVEAVHLGEQLVERLLTLVVAAEARVARLADGVDLVDEDDAGRYLRGLGKEVAHAARADAHEHLHKAGAGDGEERHVRFTRDRLGEQRFARARRADEQRAARQLRADVGILLGIVQEVDDLDEGFLRLVLTGDVGKGDAGGFFHVDLRVGLADAAEAAEAAAPGLFADEAHHQDERADHQRRGQDVVEHDDLEIRGLRLVGLAELHAVFIQERPQLGVVDLRGEELEVP